MAFEGTMARMSRWVFKTMSAKVLHKLDTYVKELEGTEPKPKNITVSKMEYLEGLTRKARETILKYEEAVIDCLEFGGVSEDKLEEDEHVVQKSKFQDSLEDWEFRIADLKSKIKEKQIEENSQRSERN